MWQLSIDFLFEESSKQINLQVLLITKFPLFDNDFTLGSCFVHKLVADQLRLWKHIVVSWRHYQRDIDLATQHAYGKGNDYICGMEWNAILGKVISQGRLGKTKHKRLELISPWKSGFVWTYYVMFSVLRLVIFPSLFRLAFYSGYISFKLL